MQKEPVPKNNFSESPRSAVTPRLHDGYTVTPYLAPLHRTPFLVSVSARTYVCWTNIHAYLFRELLVSDWWECPRCCRCSACFSVEVQRRRSLVQRNFLEYFKHAKGPRVFCSRDGFTTRFSKAIFTITFLHDLDWRSWTVICRSSKTILFPEGTSKENLNTQERDPCPKPGTKFRELKIRVS